MRPQPAPTDVPEPTATATATPKPNPTTEPAANCHADATDGDRGTYNTYHPGAYAPADTYLTASPSNGHGNDRYSHNGAAHNGVGRPV